MSAISQFVIPNLLSERLIDNEWLENMKNALQVEMSKRETCDDFH